MIHNNIRHQIISFLIYVAFPIGSKKRVGAVNSQIAYQVIMKTEPVTMMHNTTMEIPDMKIAVTIATTVTNLVITVGILTEKKIGLAIIAAEWMKKTVMAMDQKVTAEHRSIIIRIQAVTDLKTTVVPAAETD